jgi:hypothetical protein
VCLLPYTAKDGARFLFYLSGYSNNICVFSLDSQKLVKTIKLEQQGPNGVANVMGFEVINFDSIYITPVMIRKLYLVNSEAKVLSCLDYSTYKHEKEDVIQAGTSRTLENMRVGFKDDLIYLPFYPGFDEGNYKSVSPGSIRFISVLDKFNKTAKTLNIGFPEDYWQTNFYPSFFGFFIAKNNFYVNYMYDDRIMVSMDSKNWRTYIVPSRYINVKEIVPGHSSYSSILGSSYRLVYDQYRDVFYRFAIQKWSMNKDRTEKDMIQYPQKVSIMILDKDLNIIGETTFKEDLYDFSGYFITKEGLYLSKSNPFNPDYDIDLLEFQLLELKKNEI